MELNIGMGFAQRGPLGLGFLHPVLAKNTLPGQDQWRDRFGRMGLADGDQRDLIGPAPGNLRSVRNSRIDIG